MNSWFRGDDDRPGLAPDPEWEPNDLERYHCARCGVLLERVWHSVYVEPFHQVLLACSADCAHVLRVTIGEENRESV